MRSAGIVEVREKELKQWRVHRIKDGGFQRKLSNRRVDQMITSFRNGSVAPPIVVAKVGGDYFIVDGQHRFEARKHKKFPLFAQVFTMNKDSAARVFIDCNRKGVRVGLAHRLAVDPSRIAKRIRATAKKYEITHRQVYHCLIGITRSALRKDIVAGADWELLDTVLKWWSDDPRWEKDDELYSYSGTLCAVGRLCFGKKDPAKIIKLLKKYEYGMNTDYMKWYGTGSRSQKMFFDMALKQFGIKLDIERA